MTTALPDRTWRTLYRIGGVAAIVYVVMVLVPVIMIFVAPIPPTEGAALLEYIDAHRVLYVTQLVCFVGLSVPALVVFGAAAVALAGSSRSLAALGGLFGVASETIALAVGSSPQSLHGGLIVLSDRYVVAATAAQRAELASAAEALIAAANAMPWAGILTAAGILVLSLAMWRSSFGRALAVVGTIAGAVGVVAEAFRPMIGVGYTLYGLLLPLWFGWVGVTLIRLGFSRRPARVDEVVVPAD